MFSNMRGKIALIALFFLGASLFLAVPAFADSTSSASFNFTNTLGNLGLTDTLNSGNYSVMLAGYSAPGATADLFGNLMGVGVVSGMANEISGSSFVQMNMHQIFSTNPSSVLLALCGFQGQTTYQVWGSNTAGALGTLLANNQMNSTFNLSNVTNVGQYQFISVTAPNGSVLIEGLSIQPASGTTGVPEPGSANLLLIGLGALAGVTIVAKGR